MRRIGILDILLVGLLVMAACIPGARTPVAEPAVTRQATVVPSVSTTPARTPETERTPTHTEAAPTATESSAAVTSVPGQVTETPAPPARWIALGEPVLGAMVTTPVHVRGEVGITPFESTLRGRVYDALGQVLGEVAILLPSEMGQPGIFDGYIPFSAAAGGAGTVEIAEISPRDGSILESASAAVEILLSLPRGAVEIPARGQRIVLPLRILARVGQPGESVQAILHWQDGTELTQSFTSLRGEDGRGLLIESLNWPGESQPPQPPSQLAVLELLDEAGSLLARQELVVVGASDPDTQAITLYFLLGEDLQPVTRRIPKTARIGTAALEELLWGPLAPNLAGFGTALPTHQQVLDYPGREPDWGPRVTLRKLTIEDGIAMADFSKEMQAYGGGSLRVSLLRQQIELTLKQFATVQQVIIAVEGETEEVLQP